MLFLFKSISLNELLAGCSKCIVAHIIVFNAIKSYGIMSAVKKYCKVYNQPSRDGKIVKFVNLLKYLGVFLTDTLSDDCEVAYQVKYLYVVP